MNRSPITLNSLVIPDLLIQLMERGVWKHPGDEVIKTIIPFFHEPIDFVTSIAGMHVEPFPGYDHMFQDSGTSNSQAKSLPWLDSDLAIFLAINRHIGDDIAIALDYRISRGSPRVVANNWHTGISGCPWEVVAPTFEEFISRLGIKF
jgi:hypothetical protein